MFTFLIYLLVKKSVLLLTVVGGIGFAVYRWKRHPRISLMAVAALGLYLVDTVAFAIFSNWKIQLQGAINQPGRALELFDHPLTSDDLTLIYTLLSVSEDVIFSSVLILLVVAAFTGRVRESVTIDQRTDR